MTGNPLILREKRSTARSSTFSVDASFLLLFRPVSGCYGSKMGADNTGSIPQRDAIELAEFKCAISLLANKSYFRRGPTNGGGLDGCPDQPSQIPVAVARGHDLARGRVENRTSAAMSPR